MGGTRSGGITTRDKLLAENPNYYEELGKLGAASYNAQDPQIRKPRGFAVNKVLARKAGAAGGAKSKRKPKESK